jgi:hypothetical protein
MAIAVQRALSSEKASVNQEYVSLKPSVSARELNCRLRDLGLILNFDVADRKMDECVNQQHDVDQQK